MKALIIWSLIGVAIFLGVVLYVFVNVPSIRVGNFEINRKITDIGIEVRFEFYY